MLSLAIAGIGSAWIGGCARIPFVAGLDSYMPSWLGNIHPRYATPYAALIVQGIVSAVLVILNFAGAGVQETFQKLLSLAVVLHLVPFVYMFGALVKFAITEPAPSGHYGRTTLFVAGTSGLLTTILGIALVFFPTQQITSLFWYEVWMVGGTLFFVGLAAFFFFVYGRLKTRQFSDESRCSASEVRAGLIEWTAPSAVRRAKIASHSIGRGTTSACRKSCDVRGFSP